MIMEKNILSSLPPTIGIPPNKLASNNSGITVNRIHIALLGTIKGGNAEEEQWNDRSKREKNTKEIINEMRERRNKIKAKEESIKTIIPEAMHLPLAPANENNILVH